MSSLFSRDALAAPPVAADQTMKPRAYRRTMGATAFAVCPTRKVLREHLADLVPGSTYTYFTGGKWSNHHLLQHLLELSGPADVLLTTWTITEAPVRVMQELLANGTIKSLTMLTDDRIRSRCAQAWQLMQTLPATVHLSKCHAKVTVVLNDTHGYLVVSSQNFTNNPRIEAGTIICDREAALFAQATILAEVQNPTLAK